MEHTVQADKSKMNNNICYVIFMFTKFIYGMSVYFEIIRCEILTSSNEKKWNSTTLRCKTFITKMYILNASQCFPFAGHWRV